MTMSTYKSLGGPPSGLIVTNDAAVAEKLDRIAFPGMTANFDAAKSAAWRSRCSTGKIMAGPTPQTMARPPGRWRMALPIAGCRCFHDRQGHTRHRTSSPSRRPNSAAAKRAAKKLRQANILTLRHRPADRRCRRRHEWLAPRHTRDRSLGDDGRRYARTGRPYRQGLRGNDASARRRGGCDGIPAPVQQTSFCELTPEAAGYCPPFLKTGE